MQDKISANELFRLAPWYQGAIVTKFDLSENPRTGQLDKSDRP